MHGARLWDDSHEAVEPPVSGKRHSNLSCEAKKEYLTLVRAADSISIHKAVVVKDEM